LASEAAELRVEEEKIKNAKSDRDAKLRAMEADNARKRAQIQVS
jgi:hypothetical protein